MLRATILATPGSSCDSAANSIRGPSSTQRIQRRESPSRSSALYGSRVATVPKSMTRPLGRTKSSNAISGMRPSAEVPVLIVISGEGLRSANATPPFRSMPGPENNSGTRSASTPPVERAEWPQEPRPPFPMGDYCSARAARVVKQEPFVNSALARIRCRARLEDLEA